MNIKTADILLFEAGEDIVSKLVAWGTDSQYSHVAVCISSELNLAIEAMPGKKTRVIDLKKRKDNFDVYRVKEECSFDQNKAISFLIDNLDGNYDQLGVIFLGILKFFSKIGFPKKWPNKWQKDRDYFCSELCYEAFFKGGGLNIVPQVNEADITSPADISESSVLNKIS